MAKAAHRQFVRQQGFRDESAGACDARYSALMFQPRVIGIVVMTGLALQSGLFFLALSAVLWWNALLPAMNPFDALYNRLIAARKGQTRLTPAPGPRRFAQGMAATFMLGIGWSLISELRIVAWTLEGLLVAALAALIIGRFCLGSYLYLLLHGDARFANRTLPWAPETQV